METPRIAAVLPLVLACAAVPQAAPQAADGEPAAREIELFNGRDLAGWTPLGDAVWEVEDGELLGRIGGGGQSFLVTDRPYGDFRLEVDVKTELPGNSGIQIRSHVNEQGRLFGYQIEIDPSERAWSGGLYDEARRGWLQNLEGRDEARAAFRHGEWNRYAIECRGPWIRTWIDGVPITDYLDPLDMEGVIGLQVHSGNNTRVRWRSFRMVDHGEQGWAPVAPDGDWTVNQDPYSAARTGVSDPLALRVAWDVSDELAFDLGPGLRLRLGADLRRGEDVLGEGSEPKRPKQRHLAVCRAGSRIALFLDGELVWRSDAFDAPADARVALTRVADGSAATPVVFEQLRPLPQRER